MKVFFVFIVAILVLTFLALLFIYSGGYNVSAEKQHLKITEWLINTTRDRSIKEHAKNIEVPELKSPAMTKIGFIHYNEMCIDCHGAPGITPSELAKGLNPKAPDLSEAVLQWKPSELFWIIKYGIRMTGMPAWGITHSDQKIWALVAFIEELPKISQQDYKKMQQAYLKEKLND
jgi:mono/diheme cytochrome c family protein